MKYRNRIRSEESEEKKRFKGELESILCSLGISFKKEFNLILHNDQENTMIYVVISLYEVCNLTDGECLSIMLEAHSKGQSIVKRGNHDEMVLLRSLLENKGLNVTIGEVE